jgi:hypothetical protein
MIAQVVAYSGRGAGSKLIKWGTRGRFSHLSLRFLEIEKPIRDMVFDKFALRIAPDYEVESLQFKGVIGHSFERQDNQVVFNFKHDEAQAWVILRTAINLLGSGYDYRGIGGFLSRRSKHNPSKFFCSELVAYCLIKAGIVLLWLPPFKQAPNTTVSSTLLLEE